jgi:hypothetical protein
MEVGYKEFDTYGQLLMTDSRTFKPHDLYWLDIDLDLVENPEEDWIYVACDGKRNLTRQGDYPLTQTPSSSPSKALAETMEIPRPQLASSSAQTIHTATAKF